MPAIVENQAKIDSYIQYFRNHVPVVFALRDHLYRKILVVAVMDTLGRARHPGIHGNQERFRQTIRDLAEWPDGDRVSVPQLLFNLDRRPELRDGPLAREARGLLAAWPEYGIPRISSDPQSEALARLARHPEETQMLFDCRHAELLYVYRNHLVHEFREPGYDMGVLGDDPAPYYYSMEDEQGAVRWELAYPTNFFELITTRILENLRRYLEANDLDPYTFYEFGSMWRRPGRARLRRPERR